MAMNTIWFTFIVVLQFACAVCNAENKDAKKIGKLATLEVDNRIFKGQATRIENLPYQVLVTTVSRDKKRRRSVGTCGGAILRPKIIITSAHCVHKQERSKIKVRAGSSFTDRDGVIRNVAQIIEHELFKYKSSATDGLLWADYDVALLKLSKNLEYSKYIQNIEIPEPGDRLAPGDLGIVAGWGLKFDTTQATVLQKTQLPVMNDKECSDASFIKLNPRVFCAGYCKKDTSNVCDGDSGGPFVANNKVYGIVFASATDCKGSPSITYLTNISSIHTWIISKLNKLS